MKTYTVPTLLTAKCRPDIYVESYGLDIPAASVSSRVLPPNLALHIWRSCEVSSSPNLNFTASAHFPWYICIENELYVVLGFSLPNKPGRSISLYQRRLRSLPIVVRSSRTASAVTVDPAIPASGRRCKLPPFCSILSGFVVLMLSGKAHYIFQQLSLQLDSNRMSLSFSRVGNYDAIFLRSKALIDYKQALPQSIKPFEYFGGSERSCIFTREFAWAIDKLFHKMKRLVLDNCPISIHTSLNEHLRHTL